MARETYRGPTLPKFLLDKVGGSNKISKGRRDVTRRDRRKADRQQKKSSRSRRSAQAREDDLSSEAEESIPHPKPTAKQPQRDVRPPKSILKKEKAAAPLESEPESEFEDEVAPVVSRTARHRLEEDDADIAALERKLGIKGKKAKSGEEDGLDWLDEGSSDDDNTGSKRKRPEDAKWLRDKRLKTAIPQVSDGEMQGRMTSDAESDQSDHEIVENPFSADEDGFEDFDDSHSNESGDHNRTEPKRQRENPYVPPTTADAPAARYVPPSLRKPASTDEESLKHLRRQLQGQLNRLSEANMISIIKSIEEIYERNARQHVTSTLLEILVGLVSDAAVLNDTFLILHAGFSAALYKISGPDFGAGLLERLVESFQHYRDRERFEGKQTLNILAFLSCLYNFQLVGSALIFDYIRILLDELSEPNTELLLRVIRTSGQQLRQDDPSSLKDIVLLLQRSVAHVGEAQLSVRTKFMIETINNLKNNRMKSGAAGASALAAEHAARMRKTLSSLSTSRSLKATEPLNITLSDIRNSDKKGKWWLIGASYNDPHKTSAASAPTRPQQEMDDGYESETPGSVNLSKLARAQGMNTDVRRAIFITLLSSGDVKEAHFRLLKLNLRNKQMLEIPRVLVHCVRAEQTYNVYYALVARKFCGDVKMRKAFQFCLWDVFRVMEDDDEEEEGDGNLSVEKLVSLAKFYAGLVANGGLDITVLRKLDFSLLEDPESKPSLFLEVFLTTLILQCRKETKNKNSKTSFEDALTEVFKKASSAPEAMNRALQFAIQVGVEKADLARGKKEVAAVERGCKVALETLRSVEGLMVAEESESEDE